LLVWPKFLCENLPKKGQEISGTNDPAVLFSSKRGETFLDLSPVEKLTLGQRIKRSRSLQAGIVLALLAVLWLILWYTVWRIDLPADLLSTYDKMDQAIAAKDARAFLGYFSPDVEIVLDNKPESPAAYTNRINRFLLSKDLEKAEQSTRLRGARQVDQHSYEVVATHDQTIQLAKKPPFRRRLQTTTLWARDTQGWSLKSYRAKSVRVVD
jgi:hypothetical protein